MNNTLTNGFKVLEYLATMADDCSVKQIAEHFNLPNSHACRLLQTLVATGYIERAPGRKYRVSLRILGLASAKLARIRERNLARPFMQKLANEIHYPVVLTLMEQWRSLVVSTVYPDGYLGNGDESTLLGALHSINRTAGGVLTVAFAPEDAASALIAQCDWTPNTLYAETNPEKFRERLGLIRSQGYVLLRSEAANGMDAAAAALLGPGKEFRGTLGVMMPPPAELRTSEILTWILNRLTGTAELISYSLGNIPQ